MASTTGKIATATQPAPYQPMEIKTPDHRQLHLRGGNEENDRCGQQRSQDMTECLAAQLAPAS
uniref:Uncharacterized protein n=1 Tax=Bionectria ochroleuca TaxID=29856 RepID=A0A0B7K5T6_BIOOC